MQRPSSSVVNNKPHQGERSGLAIADKVSLSVGHCLGQERQGGVQAREGSHAIQIKGLSAEC
jgi:hypothetical protein